MRQLGQLSLDESASVPRLVLPAWADIPWLTHGWSTRKGGVSQGAQASLNFGKALDSAEHVEQNRELWRQTLGVVGWPEVFLNQVHGTAVAIATRAQSISQTDGVLTATPGLALHVVVADCLPILLLCREPRAVGAVHAGWRGTVGGIVQQAVARMVDELGASPQDIEACIGPGIGSCCYLVDEPVLSAVRRLPIDWQSAVADSPVSGQAYLDLPLVNKLLLLGSGLQPEHIHLSEICTHDDADHFFSHRRDRGDTGRLMATIGLIPPDKAGFAGTGREVLLQQSGDGDETSG